MIVNVLLIIVSFVLLIKGADFLVSGSSNIAKKFHIPEIIIGLTIVSIGTSMPELFVSITSAIDGFSDMAIGNVIGSNICNLLLILGLSSVIRPVKFQRETRVIEIPLSIILTIIFWFLCFTNNNINRIEAVILLILFTGFILYTIFMGLDGNKKEKQKEEKVEEQSKFFMLKNILFTIGGIAALKYGGRFCSR